MTTENNLIASPVDSGIPDYLKGMDYQVTGARLEKALPVVAVSSSIPTITAANDTDIQSSTQVSFSYDSEKRIICRRYSLFKKQR